MGLDAEVVAADIDERALEDRHLAAGGSLEGLAIELARAKALAVSALRPDAYCLGADQTLTLEGRIFHKSRDFAEAALTLAELAGQDASFDVRLLRRPLRTNRWSSTAITPSLRMRPLDPVTISRYLDRAGPAVLSCVGAYQVEGLGAHLFDRIEGDHSVVLGLPMFKLLAWLRRENLISL